MSVRSCCAWADRVVAIVGKFDDNVLSALTSSLDVEYIAEDGIMSTFDVQYVRSPPPVVPRRSDISFRNDASWNLARVSTRAKLTNQDPFALNYQYEYQPGPGDGVKIYVVDTGLFSLARFSHRDVSASTLCRYPRRPRAQVWFQ